MKNKSFELERLRSVLQSRGLPSSVIEGILNKASIEIDSAIESHIQDAMNKSIEIGVEKDSPGFINEIRPMPGAFQLDTMSGITDFSEPPFPMLPYLLNNAKPIKDGSGVYKVIPVGGKSVRSGRDTIASNIFDAQKAIQAERAEQAKNNYRKNAPAGSVKFRTATSKQNAQEQWVQPAKEKDFTEDLAQINQQLEADISHTIDSIIKEYEDNF